MTNKPSHLYSIHDRIALDAVEHDGEDAAELTARIIHLFDKLRVLDAEAAGELLNTLPNGWHGPRLVQ